MLLSGVLGAFRGAPSWLSTLLGYLPGQPILDAVTRALHTTGTSLSLPGHDLAGWAIGALLASLRLFQWEPRAPR